MGSRELARVEVFMPFIDVDWYVCTCTGIIVVVCLLWNEGWALNFGGQSSNSQYIRQKSFFSLPSLVSRLTRCLPIQAYRDPKFDVVESNYSFMFVCIHKPQSSVNIKEFYQFVISLFHFIHSFFNLITQHTPLIRPS